MTRVKIALFISAFLVHLGCQITFLLWIPDPDRVFIFYILAALWGIGDAVIQTQINGKISDIFISHYLAYRWDSHHENMPM